MLDAAAKEIYGAPHAFPSGVKLIHNEGGEVVGFRTQGEKTKTGTPRIGTIYIKPEHRRQGHAFKEAKKFYDENPEMAWFAKEDNLPSISLAKKLGLAHTGKAMSSNTQVFTKTSSERQQAIKKVADLRKFFGGVKNVTGKMLNPVSALFPNAAKKPVGQVADYAAAPTTAGLANTVAGFAGGALPSAIGTVGAVGTGLNAVNQISRYGENNFNVGKTLDDYQSELKQKNFKSPVMEGLSDVANVASHPLLSVPLGLRGLGRAAGPALKYRPLASNTRNNGDMKGATALMSRPKPVEQEPNMMAAGGTPPPPVDPPPMPSPAPTPAKGAEGLMNMGKKAEDNTILGLLRKKYKKEDKNIFIEEKPVVEEKHANFSDDFVSEFNKVASDFGCDEDETANMLNELIKDEHSS